MTSTIALLMTDPEAMRTACRGWSQTFPAGQPGVTEQINPFTRAGAGWGVRSPVARNADDSPRLLSRFPHRFLDLESPGVEGLLAEIARAHTNLTEEEISERYRPYLVGPDAATEMVMKVPDRLVRFLAETSEADLARRLASSPADIPFALEMRARSREAVVAGHAVFLVVDYS